MKQNTLPNRLNVLVASVRHSLGTEPKLSEKARSTPQPPQSRLARLPRKDLFYYLQLIDDNAKTVVGHLADISSGGFKLDSQNPIPLNRETRFRLNLTGEVADKPFMLFRARSRWCRVDPLDPFVYNVGYELVQISPEDLEIFKHMMEKYGKIRDRRTINLRRSNKW